MGGKYPFLQGIELRWFLSYDAVVNEGNERLGRFFIKTQSVCVWGDDLSHQIPQYKPGGHLICEALYIKQSIQKLLSELPAMEDEETIKGKCQWIMKGILRTGFELVMEQEQAYTRDIYPCFVAFIRHFPDQSLPMKYALECAIEPSGKKEELIQFLETFGGWLITTIENHFPEAC